MALAFIGEAQIMCDRPIFLCRCPHLLSLFQVLVVHGAVACVRSTCAGAR